MWLIFFFQAEDGIRDLTVTGVQTCALPISLQRADVHHLARHFLAAVIADRDDDEILPRLLQRRVTDHPLHAQRRGGRHLALGRLLIEAQMMQAARTDAQALEDRRLAVRTRARLARRDRARGDAHALPKPLVSALARPSPS